MKPHLPSCNHARTVSALVPVVQGAWPFRSGLFCLAVCASSMLAQWARAQHPCSPVTFRGRVLSGESYLHPITPGLDFKLEAVPSGWMVRVLPHGKARPPHDYAELANPPYRSQSPLLISTDFAFRAQDAIAWNPRNFRYFTTAREGRIAEAALQSLEHGAGSASAAGLLGILPDAKEATLTILDAELTGGTANQTPAAGRVAMHLADTAHKLRPNGPATPLGKLHSLTFQVVFAEAACRTSSPRR